MVVYNRTCISVISVKVLLDPVPKFRSNFVMTPEMLPSELSNCSLLLNMAFL